MRIISQNINGITRILNKLNYKTINELIDNDLNQYDIICFQELKQDLKNIQTKSDKYDLVYSKNQNNNLSQGVATIFKKKQSPIFSQNYLFGVNLNGLNYENKEIWNDLHNYLDSQQLRDSKIAQIMETLDKEGRILITFHHQNVVIFNVQFPGINSEHEDRDLQRKQFAQYLIIKVFFLKTRNQHVIILGDLNITHSHLDSYNQVNNSTSRYNQVIFDQKAILNKLTDSKNSLNQMQNNAISKAKQMINEYDLKQAFEVDLLSKQMSMLLGWMGSSSFIWNINSDEDLAYILFQDDQMPKMWDIFKFNHEVVSFWSKNIYESNQFNNTMFCDVYRSFNRSSSKQSSFNTSNQAELKGEGNRIDQIIVDRDFNAKFKIIECDILDTIKWSDHRPIQIQTFIEFSVPIENIDNTQSQFSRFIFKEFNDNNKTITNYFKPVKKDKKEIKPQNEELKPLENKSLIKLKILDIDSEESNNASQTQFDDKVFVDSNNVNQPEDSISTSKFTKPKLNPSLSKIEIKIANPKKLNGKWNKVFKNEESKIDIFCHHGFKCVIKTRTWKNDKIQVQLCPNPQGLNNTFCKLSDKNDINNCKFFLPKKQECNPLKFPKKPPICNHGQMCLMGRTRSKTVNHNRQYYCCPIKDKNKCKCFGWCDEYYKGEDESQREYIEGLNSNNVNGNEKSNTSDNKISIEKEKDSNENDVAHENNICEDKQMEQNLNNSKTDEEDDGNGSEGNYSSGIIKGKVIEEEDEVVQWNVGSYNQKNSYAKSNKKNNGAISFCGGAAKLKIQMQKK